MSKNWILIQSDIENCFRCRRYGYIEVDCNQPKKHPTYEPKNVKVLFTSEAPPASGEYFYCENRKDNLRRELLNILNEIGYPVSNIKQFIERGFYLVPTVKCPSKNGGNKNPRRKVIGLCIENHLKKEIEYIKPNKIVTLGRTALYAYSRLFRLSIPHGKLSDYHGKIFKISINGKESKLMITYWPTKRHGGYEALKEDLKKILNMH